MSLSSSLVKGTCHHWRAERPKGRRKAFTGLIGCCIVHSLGHTTEVVEVDSETHRIRTRTGSVYRLGAPDPEFLRVHPKLVREAGY